VVGIWRFQQRTRGKNKAASEFGIVYSLDDGNRSFLSPDPSRTYLGSMQMKVGWLYTEDVLLVKTV
jgi:hypothetical protein